VTRRLFVGVGVPPADASILAREVVAWAGPGGIPGRAVPPESWHLTLRFLGDVDEVTEDRTLAALDEADLGEAFPVTVTGAGAFPNPRRATVLWIGVREERRLAELAAAVEEAVVGAGLEENDRPFAAHLTLARIRPPADLRPLLARPLAAAVPLPVREVVLYESRPGSRYEVIERFPLR